MSTFAEYEESVQGSVPIEGYKFIGTFQTYRYTSADRNVVINGETYTPVAVSRSRVKAGTHEDDNLTLELSIPFDTPVALDYAFAQTPPKLELEVYRNQQDDPENDAWSLYWKGLVRGFTVSDRTCTVKVPSIFSLALQGEIPNIYYQAPCNHVLYSPRCGVNRLSHRFTRDIVAVTGTNITITGTYPPDGELAAGEIVNLRNGERRLILGNIGAAISIGYPFVDLLVGDDVELVKGCDHSLPTCRDKFANIINFGGFHYIPVDNPFEGSVA